MKHLAFLLLSLSVSCAQTAHFQVEEARQAPRLETVFESVHNSVVTIRTIGKSTETDAYGRFASAAGVGSGVLVSETGRILTASHVVQTADKVQVQFPDGTTLSAKVISSIPSADVAMIQLDKPLPKGATVATLGDSSKVNVGSSVFVVGAPLGISHTLTVGYVSARRSVPLSPGYEQAIELFQTDAAINPGNSGGPMFNMRGEVIGIVSHIVSDTGGNAGLGFAVTSNVARALMLERSAFWSGLDEIHVSGDLAAALNVPDGRTGMLVQRVAKGSPAEKLGLKGGTLAIEIVGQKILIGGDILLEVFGFSLSDPDFQKKFLGVVEHHEPTDPVVVVILRAGKQIELKSTFEALTKS